MQILGQNKKIKLTKGIQNVTYKAFFFTFKTGKTDHHTSINCHSLKFYAHTL